MISESSLLLKDDMEFDILSIWLRIPTFTFLEGVVLTKQIERKRLRNPLLVAFKAYMEPYYLMEGKKKKEPDCP